MIYVLFGVVCFLLFKEYKQKLTKIQFKGFTWNQRRYKHGDERVIEKFSLIPRVINPTQNEQTKVWLCRVRLRQTRDFDGCGDSWYNWTTVETSKVDDE
jgi:hypothetical protein